MGKVALWTAKMVCAFGGALVLFGALGQGKTPASTEGNAVKLSPVEVIARGQNTWICGSRAGLRLIVKNHDTGQPLPSRVRIALASQSRPNETKLLFEGTTDRYGTLDGSFSTASLTPGTYQLAVKVKTPIGEDGFETTVRLVRQVKIYLTTDKPLYQPGQIIHMRVLALDAGTLRPLGKTPITFSVTDGRGNRVFKEEKTLSDFGTVGADFQLADEVNTGVYRITAETLDSSVVRTVEVKPYVLPKFQITLKPDRGYYQPGQVVTCRLRASYFFGKPVANAEVKATVSTLDVENHELATFEGHTDAVGSYTFRYRLPETLVGQPMAQGNALVNFNVKVKDTAEQEQEAALSVPVSSQPLHITLVPESEKLLPGMPNRVYVAVSTPDGQPVPNAQVHFQFTTAPGSSDQATGVSLQCMTDVLGIGEIDFVPKSSQGNVICTVSDKQGRKSSTSMNLGTGQNAELLLRVDRPLAKVGDVLQLTCFSQQKTGTVYLDVLRNHQTILTDAVPIQSGKGTLRLPLSPDMEGTLELHAYQVLPNELIPQDVRYAFVLPANDLQLAVSTDKEEYRPGADAVIRFHVSDKEGHPVAAALGVAMVDESVFALSDLRPSLAKIYFLLEQQLLTPRYEIHGLTPEQLIPVRNPLPLQERQRAAQLLFAAARNDVVGGGPAGFAVVTWNPGPRIPNQSVPGYTLFIDTYEERYAKLVQAIFNRMQESLAQIEKAIKTYQTQTGQTLVTGVKPMELVDRGLLSKEALRDALGRPYQIDIQGEGADVRIRLTSAGLDGKFNTGDDFTLWGPQAVLWEMRGRAVFQGAMGGFAGGRMGLAPGSPMVLTMRAANASMAKPVGASAPEPRIRSYFPETLYWNPNLITDAQGEATLRLPMADSITTWRMSLLANSLQGALGSATKQVRVFQPFFVDLNLPVALTQGDRISLPVTIYNYLPKAQKVRLVLKLQPWFQLEGSNERTLTVTPEEVTVVHFPIMAKGIGEHSLTVVAYGNQLSDAVRRQIRVEPNGHKTEVIHNGTLQGTVTQRLMLPPEAVPGASKVLVKIYPGVFSQVVEGLDGLLQMPYGCFEQTSSTTYPNILILSYLQKTHQVNPAVQMRAEQYIGIGYQRLVTFEVPGGGFSWFGNPPANQVLTAYGLLEFSDMAKVRDVDQQLLHRTQQWLAEKQRADGSWLEEGPGIAEGIINRQTGALRTTAYVDWALAESGYTGPQVTNGIAYVERHLDEADDPYTLALILNLLVAARNADPNTSRVAQKLISLAHTTDTTAWWEGKTVTFTGAANLGADLETCGLAAYALARWGGDPAFTTKALNYIVQQRDAAGTWQTTQATVWCMRALLYASSQGAAKGSGLVTVAMNGQKVATLSVTEANHDILQQVEIQKPLHAGENLLEIHFEGKGALGYQVVNRYYLPWCDTMPPVGPPTEPLALAVHYDRTTLAQNDTVGVTVTIHNNTDSTVEMPLIDLGVPPGFTVETDGLEEAVKARTIDKYTVAARQIIVYLQKLTPNQAITLRYKVRALFPVKALTPLSKVYPYYDPEKVTIVPPQTVVVE
ncbi:large extracellular alpha-helical protein [Chthonomonas calidirosea]|uniref:alpha-2-macroglobulin family protein n=1 Tax=Chthonomonas calidirosea TaxID=454171 RepID=UPI0006DD4F41|nr:alpha-2-macroglobulin family protein [Chthonomonas calidirosea]CEK16141.1 large extracellular alpha-helical protein [Chthonomonas calidirosea]